MKRIPIILFFLCMCNVSLAQNKTITPKLCPLLRQLLADQKEMQSVQPAGYVYRVHSDGIVYMPALIKVDDATAAEAGLLAAGAKIGTRAGNIWTVRVPASHMDEFAHTPGISYIELDQPVQPLLDIARKKTRVDSVHKGIGLAMPYTGKGVIMGIIDFGFDYNHPVLYDTLGTAYRVKQVWELNGTGTPPAGYTFGNEITDSNAIRLQGTDNPEQTHGTGVAGLASGSGFGSPGNIKMRGIAFESEMVLVGVRRDTIAAQWMQGTFSDFIDGVGYIFNYADAAGKPCVVNISWGSQSGPHDGSTLFNQACDNLSGPGRIVVMSAGNEGEEKIHLSKTFTAADTVINTFLTFTSEDYKRTWVDCWGDSSKTFCGNVTLYSGGVAGNTTGTICIDDNSHNYILISANGLDTCFVEFITASEEWNGKPRIIIDIYNKSTDSIGVSVSGVDGTVNMWDEYYYYGFTHGYQSAFDSLGMSWAVNGNSVSTTSDMGAAESVLLVGAYCSKHSYMDINGNTWSYSGYVTANHIVPFSSKGPMLDGRIKPDITAPGLTIATAISSYDTAYTPTGSRSTNTVTSYTDGASHTYYFAEFSGTSASSPVAAGIVGLLLQANPTLGPVEIKNIIFQTAIQDAFTGALPPEGTNVWGHGKINAYQAVKMAVQMAGVYNFSGTKRLDCVLFPNPGTGRFSLDYTASKTEELRLEVVSMTGRVVASDYWQAKEGRNLRDLDLSALAKGTYIVNVTAKDGAVSITTVIR